MDADEPPDVADHELLGEDGVGMTISAVSVTVVPPEGVIATVSRVSGLGPYCAPSAADVADGAPARLSTQKTVERLAGRVAERVD